MTPRPAPPGAGRPPHGPVFERRLALLAGAIGLPGAAVALALLWTGDLSSRLQWTLSVLVVGGWAALVIALREAVVRPIQTVANMLAALLAGDYSVRVRTPAGDDALALLVREVNELGDTLREQRLGALEATAVLRKVMAEIDVAVFTFDDKGILRLVNRAGERLLAQPAERLIGRDAKSLGLGDCLTGEDGTRTVEMAFAGGAGRFELRLGEFRQGGVPHRLLVLTDLSRTLREEERQAWQRLVRVLGHEINNSLAPIKSIADSLQTRIDRAEPEDEDLEADLARGLAVIASRADALSRFMTAHARLARLPPPTPAPLDVGEWVRRVAHLETRMTVEVVAGPALTVQADPDQLEQLLINLVKNAVDAALETGGGVRVGWGTGAHGELEVWVEDEGHGLPETANLFVPFFTTKPGGSGIGLVLSRQIAEAHGGSLALENRDDGPGCRALLRLPVGEALAHA